MALGSLIRQDVRRLLPLSWRNQFWQRSSYDTDHFSFLPVQDVSRRLQHVEQTGRQPTVLIAFPHSFRFVLIRAR